MAKILHRKEVLDLVFDDDALMNMIVKMSLMATLMIKKLKELQDIMNMTPQR